MGLYNFHRVLIGAAIVFDFFFTFWAIRQYQTATEDGTINLVMAIASSVVTVALVAYLVYFNRNLAMLRQVLTNRSGDDAGRTAGDL